ncbi:hypothetical protein JCM33374_g3382 [Metschnikowia sp. JCM 33374]|nr:hypothetical protein JCM33374_g3382 [Metschnikowia sp. JCM 33374]
MLWNQWINLPHQDRTEFNTQSSNTIGRILDQVSPEPQNDMMDTGDLPKGFKKVLITLIPKNSVAKSKGY